MRPDYILSIISKYNTNQHLVDELHTYLLTIINRCLAADNPLTSTMILPYHESLPVPHTVLPCMFGYGCFRVFPQFDDL